MLNPFRPQFAMLTGGLCISLLVLLISISQPQITVGQETGQEENHVFLPYVGHQHTEHTTIPAVTSTPSESTPTSNPTPTRDTGTAIPQPTPSSVAYITPYPGAPPCPDHDPIKWHGLWDSVQGCHYNHTHNADPSLVDDLFGVTGALWGGQSISYPWHTPHENEHKHEGYKYLVERDLPPLYLDLNWSRAENNNAITDIRLQHHRAGGGMDLMARHHSFYQEMRICTSDLSRCGIMQTGGWADYGILHSPYKNTFVPLPGTDPSPVNQTLDEDPYRSARPADVALEISQESWANCRTCGATNDSLAGDIWSLWTTAPDKYGFNKLAGVFTIVFDDWHGIDHSNPRNINILCDPEVNPCRFNNSEHALFTAWAYVPPSLDDDGDGFVTYHGYTDRMGTIVHNCTEPGQDCVPLVIENAPVGYAAWNVPADNGKWMERFHDYDSSPSGEWWIGYPN